MKIRIIGDAPAAAVLAGLLAAEKQEVVWAPDIEGDRRLKALRRRPEIRLILPQGWVCCDTFRLSSSAAPKAGELAVIAAASAVPRPFASAAKGTKLLLLNGEPEELIGMQPGVPGPAVFRGISLLEAYEWDPGLVEVCSARPRLILEREALSRDQMHCLKACGISVQEVEDVSPLHNAQRIRELLDLPTALCHSTLDNFLSYPEGREIAVSLLEEGLRLYSHRGLPLGRLPDMDPQELLQRLKKKPREFDKFRNVPGRAFGAGLQHLLAGDNKAARSANDRIVRLCSQTGIDPKWNWAVTQKLNRAQRVGFYKDPADLYDALALG